MLLLPSRKGVTAFWLVFLALTDEGMARLSWPGWSVTYRDKCPASGIEPEHGHPSKY